MSYFTRSWNSRSRWHRLGLLTVACLVGLLVEAIRSDIGLVLVAVNTLVTPTHVMRKVAKRLVNDTVFGANVNRSLDPQYRAHGVKQGDTVKARLPQRYQVSSGAVMNPTPIQDQTVDVTITDQKNVGFEFGAWSLTLEVDDYMERYVSPAVDALVNEVDYTGLARMYKATAKAVGTPGVIPGSTGTLPQAANRPYLDAVVKLQEAAVPSPYCAVIDSDMHSYLVNGNITLFHPAPAIAAQYRNGQFAGMALGVKKWLHDQNVATHMVGALGGTPLVDGASQAGATINLNGAGGAVTNYFREGDVIQFASVYEINPLAYTPRNKLKDFVITTDTDADASGDIVAPIAPSLKPEADDNFRNASASPVNGDAVTTFGDASAYAGLTSPQGLVYNRDAYALVMADLYKPTRSVDVSERISNTKLGISIRFLKGFDIINDKAPARLDIAYGWKAVRDVLGCRVCA